MSNALAIASVTAILKDLLNNGLIDHNVSATVGNVIVSALSPDRIDVTSLNQQSQLNIFLYQVTYNAGWRNVGLPSRNSYGERTNNPPLALNLHYLMTAYGAQEFHAEILLGYGMQLLHETPVLTRNAIRTALAPPSPVSSGGGLPTEMQALFTSELAEQVEQIKICHEGLNTEEISRMWTAFQAHYRPSTAYQVSVILIESEQSTKTALPVRARKIYLVPFTQPVIEEVKSQEKAGAPVLSNQPILSGQNLVLTGRGLRADKVSVNIGGSLQDVADSDVTDTQVIVSIPATLQAGIQGVQLIHRKLMGSPPELHSGVESNVAAFVLRPQVENVTASNLQGTGNNPRSADLTVTVNPAIGNTQRVVLLLNEIVSALSPPQTSPPEEAQSYSFVAPSRIVLSPPSAPPGPSKTITIPVRGVKAGSYLARVQIDGAESPLESDASGRYVAPQVTIS